MSFSERIGTIKSLSPFFNSPFSIRTCVGADLRVGPPNGRTPFDFAQAPVRPYHCMLPSSFYDPIRQREQFERNRATNLFCRLANYRPVQPPPVKQNDFELTERRIIK